MGRRVFGYLKGSMLPRTVPPEFFPHYMYITHDSDRLKDGMETLLLVSKSIEHLEVSMSLNVGILKNLKTGFM